MKTCKLDPQKFPKIQRNLIILYLALSLVCIGIGYLYIGPDLFKRAWGLIPFIFIVFALAGWYAIRQRKKYWHTFQLTLKGDTLIKSAPKLPDQYLTKSKISKVEEVRQGLLISIKSKGPYMLIPRHLSDQDYAALKKTLERWLDQAD